MDHDDFSKTYWANPLYHDVCTDLGFEQESVDSYTLSAWLVENKELVLEFLKDK